MYKLILVDDEEEVRKGILDKIEWQKYGFEIAGEAENGIEALEIAEKCIPDVVITDIKMPFMDGLALSQKIREKYADTKIIILTGFDEFEYARKAVKLDIVEYILKPISSKELINVLVRVKNEIDNEITRIKDAEVFKEYYIKSLPLLREKFLGSLITGRFNKNEMLEKTNIYGINLSHKGFFVSVMDADFEAAHDVNVQEGRDALAGDAVSEDSSEFLRLAALNLSSQIMDKYGMGLTFLHDDYIVLLFFSEESDRDKMLAKVLAILQEIRQSIGKYHSLDATIGVGTFCSNIKDISLSYKNAAAALDYSLILGNDRIICIDDVEPQCIKKVVFDELKERLLVSSIKVGTNEEIMKTIDGLLMEITDKNVTFKDCQMYLLEMLTAILRTARDLNIDLDSIFGENYNVFIEMYKFRNLIEIKDWLINICTRIKIYLSRNRQNTRKLLVNKALDYVKQYYCDSELTIDRMCNYLYISSAYFSNLFKKETKHTFVNYLTMFRLNKAKELLGTTNLKTFEIARAVGYSEPNYFSYCFKKSFNISPSEYKREANKM